MQSILQERKEMADLERVHFDHELIEFHEKYTSHLLASIIVIVISIIMFIGSSTITGLIDSSSGKAFFANWIVIPLVIAFGAGGYLGMAYLKRPQALKLFGLFEIKSAAKEVIRLRVDESDFKEYGLIHPDEAPCLAKAIIHKMQKL